MVYQITQEEDRMLMEAKEIFKYLEKKLYDKIPNKIKDLVNSYDGQYIFKYDKGKTLNEQNISQKTKDFIVYIFYSVANEEEKNIFEQKMTEYEEEIKKQELEMAEKYSYDNLFKKRSKNISNNEETTLIVKEKESIILKIINKIKLIFLRKDK